MMRSPLSKVRKLLVGVTMLSALLLAPARAGASPIVFQHAFPAPDTTIPWCSSCNGQFQEFDQFVLAAATVVTQIDARFYLDPTSVSLDFQVWDATRTTMLFSQIFTQAQLTLVNLGGSNPNYDVTAFITGLTLGAGTYNLSIFDATGYVGWYQSNLTVDGQSFQTGGGGGTAGDQAFRIYGDPPRPSAVPEPGTFVLLGTGVAMALVRVRRMKARR